jgi:hypothetical protein
MLQSGAEDLKGTQAYRATALLLGDGYCCSSVAAATQLQGAVATGSSARSRNLGGIVDFRFLTITGLDPVATAPRF